MAKSDIEGTLHQDEDGDREIFALLQTKLGWICVSLKDGQTWGGLQRTSKEALTGLTPLGYRLDLDDVSGLSRPFQE